jgi:hypothetical protein
MTLFIFMIKFENVLTTHYILLLTLIVQLISEYQWYKQVLANGRTTVHKTTDRPKFKH